ncbi:hypothetical protein QQP08_013936 [Theobroma cacao]|nr:hypothetical protein QQP08_013936 [Theobroma cacao]
MKTLFLSQELWDLSLTEVIFSRIVATITSKKAWEIFSSKVIAVKLQSPYGEFETF